MSKLPSCNPKLPKMGSCYQPNWSLDKLLKELQECGVESALRIKRTKSNEVTITVNTRDLPKDVTAITRTLFSLYGISK